MKFNAAKCPNCGGELQVPDGIDVVSCMYCKSDIVLQDISSKKADFSRMLHLAKSAEQAKNYSEAESYYTKILEQDITCIDAWIGKGVSAGWQTSLQNLRLEEIYNCFKKACELSPENEQLEKLSVSTIEIAHAVQFLIIDKYNKLNAINDVSIQNDAIQSHFNESTHIIVFLENVFDLLVARKKSWLTNLQSQFASKVVCPFCEQRYEYDEIYSGQEVQCQSCNNTFIFEESNQQNDESDENIKFYNTLILATGNALNQIAGEVVNVNKKHNWGSAAPDVQNFCESKINKITNYIKSFNPDYNSGYKPPSVGDQAVGCIKMIFCIIGAIIVIGLIALWILA